ncbi:MAG TPA: protein kinase [Bryobacteraceae bacterium]|nr:protein kinase [Bryobacteraceae bacterium]
MNPMIGQALGHYRIEAKLGEGGMGLVYRAFDTHLDRPVAIKILRADATSSPERKRRFVQEAKAASALNHPNIIHIYDISSSEGTDFIAMEFVAGKTLDQLIGKSGLPLKNTLKYSIQIADALARAHSAGIVHRDLKPANIIVGEDGRVKLLDFGLAKLTEPTDDSEGATATLTATDAPQTEEGSIVGTIAYMSPEQAEGKKVDARSDIFSFGSVLYEMVTGRRAFEGGSKLSTLSAILHKEPQPLVDLAPNLPAELEKIISRCLRKDPERRAQHAGDIKLALEELREESESGKLSPASQSAAAQAPARRSFPLAAILSGAAVLLAAAGAFLWMKRSPSAPAGTEWVQITNFADSVSQPALSPDGRMLTFIRGPKTFIGPGQVYIKMLPSGDPVQLTHDDLNKMSPAFSPDGSRIAYSTNTPPLGWDTWVVPVLGGDPRVWLPNAAGLVWCDRSKLLFSEIKEKPLHMGLVTAAENRTGERDLYLPAHQRGMAHRSYLSPDGKSILVVEMNERGDFDPCRLLPAEGNSPGKQVGPPDGECTFAAWSPHGEWMYFSSNAGGVFHTWRRRFPDGPLEQITSGPTEEEGIAMAADGRSFVTAVGERQSSVWVHDSQGDRQISVEGQAFQPKFTPDAKKLLYRVRTGSGSELWVAELGSNHTEPLLPGFPAGVSAGQGAVWSAGYDISPDGRQVVFFSRDREGKLRLWLTPLDRRTPPRQIPGVEGEQPVFGPSGEVFFRRIEGPSAFLYSVREDGSELRKVFETPVVDVFGVYPDHKWLLLGASSEGEVLLPTGGGAPLLTRLHPPDWLRWSGDGKHLFLVGVNGTRAKAYVLPLSRGEVLPSFALGKNLPSDPELAKLPGVRIIPVGDVVSGPTADIYAFVRESVHRNLYRIPLP